jgi:hypothetical protein
MINFRDDEYCATTTSKMKIKVAKDDNMIRKKKIGNMEGLHAYDHVVAKIEVYCKRQEAYRIWALNLFVL